MSNQIIDFKTEIMDYLMAAEEAARAKLQEDLNRRFVGKMVTFHSYTRGKAVVERTLVQRTEVVSKLVLEKGGYGLYIITAKGDSYKMHPSSGMEMISDENTTS